MITRGVLVILFASLVGCQSGKRGPYVEQALERRDTAQAAKLNRRAADIIVSNPKEAERLLRDALSHDLHFGPAHNNLGILFLGKGNLYEASSEFEWARKLMPGHPDPRVNLAIALERGGQIDDAIAAYESALETRPELEDAMVGLAMVQLKNRRSDDRTKYLLERIAVASTTESKRAWALTQLAKLRRSIP